MAAVGLRSKDCEEKIIMPSHDSYLNEAEENQQTHDLTFSSRQRKRSVGSLGVGGIVVKPLS